MAIRARALRNRDADHTRKGQTHTNAALVPDRSAEFLLHAPRAHRNGTPLPVELNPLQHNHCSCHSRRSHRNGSHTENPRRDRDPTASKSAPGARDTRTADAHRGDAREQHPDVLAPENGMRVAGHDAQVHAVGQVHRAAQPHAVAQVHAVAQTVPGVAAGPACRGRIE
jgi:hypothetical protein